MLRIFLLFLLVAHATILPGKAIGQERPNAPCPARTAADSDSVRREIDREPPFGIYKDNYFVTGSSFSHGGPNKYNSDAKFQISLRYRLIQGVLPYNTYLFLTYTQKSFWEIYRKSKPFSDNNYNPTLGLGNLLRKNGKAVGLVMLQYEHESNGRDSIWSRSWNRISLLGQIFFSRNWSMEVKLWAAVFAGRSQPRHRLLQRLPGSWQPITKATTSGSGCRRALPNAADGTSTQTLNSR